MRSPSHKNLMVCFDLTREQANVIKTLCKLVDSRDELRDYIVEHCPETDAYAMSCYSNPYTSAMWRRTLVLHAIDRVLGTYGVEPLGEGDNPGGAPLYEYCNTGDTYATTLVYKTETDTLFIASWGDLVERDRRLAG